MRAPYKNIVPPAKAINQRVRFETFGPLVVSILALPKIKPDVKPPTRAPKNTGMIQSSSGFLSPPAILSRYGVRSTCAGLIWSSTKVTIRVVPPEEPSPLPVRKDARNRRSEDHT